ncbi:MAG: hybrid sensor histidine kinase/response regulator [Bacteroidales bacterium]|nr:hybrid sensor histidine kinase/response regulator [Bacteroidales bacterium]
MGDIDQEFLKRLLATFRVEAEEHVRAMSNGLLALEKESSVEKQLPVIESVFREAHSLKGAARAVNMKNIERICQALESVFEALKSQDLSISTEMLNSLHTAVDIINELLISPEKGKSVDTSKVIEELQKILKKDREEKQPEQDKFMSFIPIEDESMEGEEPPVDQEPTEVSGHIGDRKVLLDTTVRISTAKLDSLFLQAEEMISIKQATKQRIEELKQIVSLIENWKSKWIRINPEIKRIRKEMEKSVHGGEQLTQKSTGSTKVFDFLDWNEQHFSSFESKISSLITAMKEDQLFHNRMVDTLLGDVKSVLMMPFSSLLGVFPKITRDLAFDKGKKVELIIKGEEIEIDKRILEEIKDPLIHIIRNCIDHGIETPQVRIQNNKSQHGTVFISISQKESSKVEIRISDNGAGIDLEKIKSTAIKSGIITAKDIESLSHEDILSFIFHSGFSTSPIITDISGRGLGLAIVKEKVEKLGGEIKVETEANTGVVFRLILPMALATFKGIIIKSSGQQFIVPISHVERALRIASHEIKTVENTEAITLDGKTLSLVHLEDILELPRQNKDTDEFMSVLILCNGENQIAFCVDAVLDEQEILVKSLGKQLFRVRNIAASTILGSGKLVPILNVSDLLQSAIQSPFTPGRKTIAEEPTIKKRNSVLIAEDSITARMLLKNILESAGYIVTAKVDGFEAFMELKEGNYDMLVSDIDMPVMNGFELTENIRKDKKLAELPVVLVTSLSSQKDRKRGIEVGANAYIIKSSFDQKNLLEIINRLI